MLNEAGIHEPDWEQIGVAVLNKPLHVFEFYENWSRPSWKALADALGQIGNLRAATTARQEGIIFNKQIHFRVQLI